MDTSEPRLYGSSAMSDEERIAILADLILDAISAEEAQGAETEG
jgi:hypothetical protein